MKYLVMECRTAYAVVLSEDGAFHKVANLRYQVGQTVTDVVPLNLPQTQPAKTARRGWKNSLAAMAACLALLLTGLFFYDPMPYASVYLSINPQVRIDVNRNDRVVGLEGVNSDGLDLLEGYDHHRKDLDTVMDELVDLAIDSGYLHEGGRITLSLDGSEEWVSDHGAHLTRHLQEHLADTMTVTIDIQQLQPAPVQTLPAPVVIPVGPEHYGDSDYGTSDYGDGESDYGASDYGVEGADYGASDDDDVLAEAEDTGYEEDLDDGQTDYGSAWEEDSGYSDWGDSGDGDSGYDDD